MIGNGIRPWIIAVSFVLLWMGGCRVETTETVTPAPLISISIQPSAPSLVPGTNLRLEAIGTYENGATNNITSSVVWQSADPGIVSVDASGLAAASTAGSTTVTARLGTISSSTVVTSSPLVSIALSPADPTIAGGTGVGFTATGTLLNGAVQNLTSFATWSSSNTAVANVTSGQANALSSTPGAATITASFGTITGSTVLTSADVSTIAVTPLTASIVLGTSQQFIATGGLAGGFTQDLTSFVSWQSSSPTVAAIGTAGASPGLAVSASAGATAISASFVSFGATRLSNPAALTVQPATLVSIAVTPINTSIALGSTQQFTATGTFSDGTTQDVTASATWTSSGPLILSISNTAETKGLASALAVGTATVTASFSGVTSNPASVTVTTSVLTSISISPSNPTVSALGGGVQFTARGTFSDNSTQDLTAVVTWSSSSGIALISNAVGSKGQVTTTGSGTATITATFGSVSGGTTLTITPF